MAFGMFSLTTAFNAPDKGVTGLVFLFLGKSICCDTSFKPSLWEGSNIRSQKKKILFILSSEFNAYLKQIKVILSVVKKYSNFSLVTNMV